MVPPGGIRGNRPRLRGDAVLKPRVQSHNEPTTALVRGKKRVLFVCLGNSCRSQMAEAFARTYGSDILMPHSAGLTPAMAVAPLTIQVLEERNVQATGQFPKSLAMVSRQPFDLVINMSGQPLAIPQTRMVEWSVPDPIGQKPEIYRSVASQIGWCQPAKGRMRVPSIALGRP